MAGKGKRDLARRAQQSQTPAAPETILEVHRQEAHLHVGPLPHPDTLARYEEVLPGSAERILAMAERQSDHRMGLERAAVHSEIRRTAWGMVAGWSLATLSLGGGILLGMYGHTTEAVAIVGIVNSILGAAFLYGRNKTAQERVEKTRFMTGQQ